MSMATRPTAAVEQPASLARALGTGDLTWLYVVAIVNLNVVPVVAGNGFRAIWLWVAAVALFFLPQGIAVVELAERMPGEGGLYLWAKDSFGDFHGFLCGWCYWITNMFFVPTLLFYVGGILAYGGGQAGAGLAESRVFFFAFTVALLWLTIAANIRGLGVGKWVNNAGGIGALLIAFALFILGALVISAEPRSFDWRALAPGNLGALPFSAFGVVCLALVGLEIGPVMGDEIRDPRRTIPRSVVLGGVLCAVVYIGATVSLLISVPQSQITVVQGTMQAIDQMSSSLGLKWVLLPLAILMMASIVGSTSAWVSGSARILFVTGIDLYLPRALGRIHPRHASPYVALAMFGVLATAIIAMSFVGASVKEAYVTLLDLSVVLQMLSYLYLFLALFRAAFVASGTGSSACPSGVFPLSLLRLAAVSGLLTTLFGLAMAFVPTRQISSIWIFEAKMLITTALFVVLARALFVYYSRRKTHAA
jgi:glutamate:GABA antiporter